MGVWEPSVRRRAARCMRFCWGDERDVIVRRRGAELVVAWRIGRCWFRRRRCGDGRRARAVDRRAACAGDDLFDAPRDAGGIVADQQHLFLRLLARSRARTGGMISR